MLVFRWDVDHYIAAELEQPESGSKSQQQGEPYAD